MEGESGETQPQPGNILKKVGKGLKHFETPPTKKPCGPRPRTDVSKVIGVPASQMNDCPDTPNSPGSLQKYRDLATPANLNSSKSGSAALEPAF